ncbi:MAG: hypothetical protein QXI22_08020 [Sulfolobales archaeon]
MGCCSAVRVRIEIRADEPEQCYVVLWVGVSLDGWRPMKPSKPWEELLIEKTAMKPETPFHRSSLFYKRNI